MKYNPALDGVRALAVAVVIAYHCSRDFMPGGFIGVDVFFVLSGYLITSLLFSEYARTGTISFREFYIRRAMRLWPPLLVMLAIYLAMAPFFFPDQHAAAEAILAGLYLSDYAKAFLDMPHILSHTWSLSVEEHYYLLWPAVVLLLARHWPNRAFAILVAAFVASTAWRIADALLWDDFIRTYYRFDTRMSGLLLGSALAVTPWRPEVRTANRLALFGIAGLVWALVNLEWKAMPALLMSGTLVDISAACLVLSLHAAHETLAGRILSWQPLVYVGSISYSLYLLHYPVVRALRGHQDPAVLALAAVLISLTLAVASYEFLEKPLKALRHRRALPKAGNLRQSPVIEA